MISSLTWQNSQLHSNNIFQLIIGQLTKNFFSFHYIFGSTNKKFRNSLAITKHKIPAIQAYKATSSSSFFLRGTDTGTGANEDMILAGFFDGLSRLRFM
ncbi:hypothetical protein ES332_A10G173300v1 [Gossypium tomentosum]|uniref:Uncharacterized protein n=1 Tax=Gossypium tomentosum TaxID=34277 RepID=A0A5D2NRR1_GOSTO|nr:hypothetical protein ES332_A10G173300v1 [Gossypium tomentosum]